MLIHSKYINFVHITITTEVNTILQLISVIYFCVPDVLIYLSWKEGHNEELSDGQL